MESDLMKLPRGLQIAREMAKKSNEPFLLGSVVYNSGRVISKGYNRYRGTNALANKYFGFHTVHAEVDALYRAPEALRKGSVIYVFRIRRDGSMAMAAPCFRCQIMLKALGIRKAIYSISEAPYYQEMRIS